MRVARLTTGLALALACALGPSVACATGDEKQAANPPAPDATRPLEAGIADAPAEDVTDVVPATGCSPDGFCYVPVPSSKPVARVSASSADDAWMLPQQSGALLRWNGASIEQVYEYEGATPSSITFVDLWAEKADQVWAVATSSDDRLFFVRHAPPPGGGAPEFRELATDEPSSTPIALWGTPAGDALWLATSRAVLRVREDANGAVVDDVSPRAGADDEHGYVWSGVWGFGPEDVFAAGVICPSSPCGAEVKAVVAHYDGTGWTITTLDSAKAIVSLRGTPPGAERRLWYDASEEPAPGEFVLATHLVAVTSAGELGPDLYMHRANEAPACSSAIGHAPSASVGWFSSGGLLCRWTGSALVPVRTAVAERPMIDALNGIWAGGTDDVWLVGSAVTRTGLPQGAIAARRTAATAQGAKP